MIHDVCEVDGKFYKAVRDGGLCDGCAAEFDTDLCGRLGSCGKEFREDTTSVVWKVHIKLGEVIDE